jgi:uncharacterized membrane protein YheB (UPF0754 family)
MEIVLNIVFMVAVGALIGAFTNHIAILMLFRPHRPIYFGSWRLPFTPGVIPRRREELAVQMGRMVVDYLLTPESIKKKLLNEKFQNEFADLAVAKIKEWRNSELALAELLRKIGLDNPSEWFRTKVDRAIEIKYAKLMEKYRERSIESVLPSSFVDKLEEKLPLVSRYILDKGIDFFQSTEGKARIQRMIDDFMKDRGMFGNMMQMLLGNVNLVDKIQPEIIKFLKNRGTEEMLTAVLSKELNKALGWDIKKVECVFEKANLLKFLKETTHKLLRIENVLNRPFKEYDITFQDADVKAVAAKVVHLLGEQLNECIESLWKKLRLQEVVQEQVQSFSVERLEMMVLSIIQRELKMITYLGGVLGGIIGFFQGGFMLIFK